MSDSVKMAKIPNCNLCEHFGEPATPAAVDGRMAQGSWVYMCANCWMIYGCGQLGTGNGQKLIKAVDGK